MDKSSNGYKGKRYVHDKDKIVCYFYGHVGHMTSKFKDLPKKGVCPMHSALTREDPKIFGHLRSKLFLSHISLTNKKEIPIMLLK